MGKIVINGMEFFAFHGHYPEEKLAGNKFELSVCLWTNTKAAEESDNIEDTLNYQAVYLSIKDIIENTKCNLLEHLARSILNSLFENYMEIDKISLELNKMHPPMGGQIKSVGVVLEEERVK